ncbi:MAG: RdgB/HAM1 family non-canonical purine NTP pyrophosphatase [Clostridia bacterium]|nr:RdgB/HAM1 family non-canonical purine NTP pyrophosphatase [Clostridia bacterium]
MDLVIASNNAHKIEEIRAILGARFRLLSMADIGLHIEIEETGETLVENALIKARAVSNLTGLPCLADDTGLLVDALDGAPGVRSARFAGEDQNDQANRNKMLALMEGIPVPQRTAHFETVLVLRYPNGQEIIARGRVDGFILTEEHGTQGFGYDSIFYCNELQIPFGEASAEAKNSVSHRGKALANLVELL